MNLSSDDAWRVKKVEKDGVDIPCRGYLSLKGGFEISLEWQLGLVSPVDNLEVEAALSCLSAVGVEVNSGNQCGGFRVWCFV